MVDGKEREVVIACIAEMSKLVISMEEREREFVFQNTESSAHRR